MPHVERQDYWLRPWWKAWWPPIFISPVDREGQWVLRIGPWQFNRVPWNREVVEEKL
jgi:hypothetical protein